METTKISNISDGNSGRRRKRKKGLFKGLIEKIESLLLLQKHRRPAWLRELCDQNADRWLPIRSIVEKLTEDDGITKDDGDIWASKGFVAILRTSETMEIDEDGTKVRVKATGADDGEVPSGSDRILYVDNLPGRADDEWLKRTFSPYGRLVDAWIVQPRNESSVKARRREEEARKDGTDPATNSHRRNKGFGFVQFGDSRTVEELLRKFGSGENRAVANRSTEGSRTMGEWKTTPGGGTGGRRTLIGGRKGGSAIIDRRKGVTSKIGVKKCVSSISGNRKGKPSIIEGDTSEIMDDEESAPAISDLQDPRASIFGTKHERPSMSGITNGEPSTSGDGRTETSTPIVDGIKPSSSSKANHHESKSIIEPRSSDADQHGEKPSKRRISKSAVISDDLPTAKRARKNEQMDGSQFLVPLCNGRTSGGDRMEKIVDVDATSVTKSAQLADMESNLLKKTTVLEPESPKKSAPAPIVVDMDPDPILEITTGQSSKKRRRKRNRKNRHSPEKTNNDGQIAKLKVYSWTEWNSSKKAYLKSQKESYARLKSELNQWKVVEEGTDGSTQGLLKKTARFPNGTKKELRGKDKLLLKAKAVMERRRAAQAAATNSTAASGCTSGTGPIA